MANPNAPFGLRPTKHYMGGVIRENEYTIADGYATALYPGDPVVCTGTGKNIQIATAGTSSKITGVFMGCEYVNSAGDTMWGIWPAAQATLNAGGGKALVIDDPFVMFDIMFDTLAAADVRALANLVAGAGDAARKLSGWSAAHPPGAGENQLKIMSVPLNSLVDPGGVFNAYGAYAVATVLIAQHELHAGAIANL